MLLHDNNVKLSTVTCTQVYYSIFLCGKLILRNISEVRWDPFKVDLICTFPCDTEPTTCKVLESVDTLWAKTTIDMWPLFFGAFCATIY